MKNYPVKSSPVVAGATSVAALFAASSLDATIVYSVDQSWAGAAVGDGGVSSFAWNIDGDESAEMTLASFRSTDPAFSSTSSTPGYGIDMKHFNSAFAFRTDGLGKLQNLGNSAHVSTSEGHFDSTELIKVLNNGVIGNAKDFTSGESGYLGFQFTPDTTPLYGWAEVVLTNGSKAGSFNIVRWAYEDSGANIQTGDTVGVIPEPAGAATGLGLLALGAAGVRRMRRPQAA
jgi:MYXO-CTERM domain-containing protein